MSLQNYKIALLVRLTRNNKQGRRQDLIANTKRKSYERKQKTTATTKNKKQTNKKKQQQQKIKLKILLLYSSKAALNCRLSAFRLPRIITIKAHKQQCRALPD